MSDPVTSADLLIKLYELRRESTMREARNWVVSFFPDSAEDVVKTMIDPSTSAYYRMVTSFWDMAASFVNRRAIDEQMFLDSGNEGWVVFAKVQPFLDQVRVMLDNPNYLSNLEMLFMRQHNAHEECEFRRKTMKRWMTARAEMAAKTAA